MEISSREIIHQCRIWHAISWVIVRGNNRIEKQQRNMANQWEMTGQWDRKFIATLRHRRDVLRGHNKGFSWE